jgi:glycosyltransferase involved in cell wall biosynthesis
MKLAFISESYPPTSGGVATSTQRIARELCKQGVDVQVICFDNTRPIDSEDYTIDENDEGVQVTKIGPFFIKQTSVSLKELRESERAVFRRRAFNQMVQILSRRERFDVLLSFYLYNPGYLALFVSRELGLPFIAGVRGNDIGLNIFNIERFAVTQWVINGADKIVCVNEHLKRRLLLVSPDAHQKTIVIPNSVSIPEMVLPKATYRERVQLATGWNDKDLRVVFIGTLREKKGIVTLVKAISSCREVPIRMLVVGPEPKPSELAACQNLWSQLKSEGYVYVTGNLPRSKVNDWAYGCDAVVMPSLDDGMSNGLLEGMALGLCPIASTIFSDVIRDNITGLIVPCGNAEALADAFNTVARNREKANEMGRNTRRFVENCTPSQEALSYKSLFESVISNYQ